MFDVPRDITVPTAGMCLYVIGIYIFFLLFNNKRALTLYQKSQYSKSDNYAHLNMFIILLLILETHFFESDYFGYRDLVVTYNTNVLSSNYLEPVYGYIINMVNSNYLLFRLIVWGLALVLAEKVIVSYGIDKYLGLFCLFSMFSTVHFVSRSALALGIYFTGFKELNDGFYDRDLFKKAFGIILMLIAYLFHSSVIFLILITFVFFLPNSKKGMGMVLFLLPLLIVGISSLFSFVLQHKLINNPLVLNKLNYFTTREDSAITVFGFIRLIFDLGIFYLPVMFISRKTFKNFDELANNKPEFINLYKLMLGIIVFSTTILLMDFGSQHLALRTMWMSTLPIVVLLSGYLQMGLINTNLFVNVLLFGQIKNLYAYVYALYAIMR